jgi:hypothetical protein
MMALVIHHPGKRSTVIDEGDRIRIVLPSGERFELRESPHGGLCVTLEEHEGELALTMAVLPQTGNRISLKGGLR